MNNTCSLDRPMKPIVKKYYFPVFSLVLMCLISSSGCDFIYRILQKEGAQEKDILGEMVPGGHNARVQKVQTLLKLYGYKIGSPDGVLGATTRDAIEKFQEDNKLKVSRFVDKETWSQLLMYEDLGLVKNGMLNMIVIQAALKRAGFDPGPVDGYGGRRTQNAIKDFQGQKGLHPDGRAGLRTLQELGKYLE